MFEQRDFSFIYKYFTAEKQETLLFLIVGIIAIGLAIICWFFIKSNPAFLKGAAFPLLALGSFKQLLALQFIPVAINKWLMWLII